MTQALELFAERVYTKVIAAVHANGYQRLESGEFFKIVIEDSLIGEAHDLAASVGFVAARRLRRLQREGFVSLDVDPDIIKVEVTQRCVGAWFDALGDELEAICQSYDANYIAV